MSTLEIHWPRHRAAPQQMWSWSSPSESHLTVTLLHDQPLRDSRRVWLANMNVRGGYATSEVVVKFARGREELAMLEAEATLYDNELRYLQDTIVPRCHGLFRGSGGIQGALVLEYRPGRDWGKCPPHYYEQFSIAIRRLHDAGVIHRDLFSKGHFWMTSNGPCIVDFGRATKTTATHTVKSCKRST